MSSTTFQYRYETGWQGNDGTLENTCEYFAKKIDAMMFALSTFEQIEAKTPGFLSSVYVYDRCLNLTRWYWPGRGWTRKQPLGQWAQDRERNQ